MRHATHQKHGGNNNNNNNQQNHPGGSGVQNNQNGILLGNGQHNGAILPTMQMGFDFGAELAGFCSPGKFLFNFFLFHHLLFLLFINIRSLKLCPSQRQFFSVCLFFGILSVFSFLPFHYLVLTMRSRLIRSQTS